MNKFYSFIIILSCFFTLSTKAQIGINTSDPKASLDIRKKEGTMVQGLLLPALTETEIQAMVDPVESLLVYNTTKQCIYIYKITGATGVWQCVEFNKQSFSVTFEGSQGEWVKNLPTTEHNRVLFKVTNNLDIPIKNVNLNDVISLPNITLSYTVTPISNYSNVNFPPGSSRVFTYKITPFKPNFTGDLAVKFSSLGREVTGNVNIQDESSVRATLIMFSGDYLVNKAFTASNTLTLKISNFSNSDLNNVNLSNALTINGGGYTIISPPQNNSVNIPSMGSVSVTYQLQGTPSSPGVITAMFNPTPKIAGAITGSQNIEKTQNVTVSSLVIEGIYIEGTSLNNTNYVSVTIQNNNPFALEHLDLSNALSLEVGSGISIVPGQYTDYTIGAGETRTLTYQITGNPSGDKFTATWNNEIFGTKTSTQPIKTLLRIEPNFVVDTKANGTYNQSVNIIAGTGNSWSITNLGQLPSWVEIGSHSGTGQSSVSITLKSHTTSEAKVAEIFVKRDLDGAIGKIIVTKPATNELKMPYFEQKFSINGETRTATVTNDTSSSIGSILEAPDWIESVTLNSPPGTLIITAKSRTTSGPEMRGYISFTYGPGNSYVYRTQEIVMRPKAELCPDTPPHHRLVPYYRIKYLDDDSEVSVQLASKPGFHLFETYGGDAFNLKYYYTPAIEKEIVNDRDVNSYFNAKLFFANRKLRIWGTYDHRINNYQDDTYKAKIRIIYQSRKDLSASDINTFSILNGNLDQFIEKYINNPGRFNYIYNIDVNGVSTYSHYTLENMPPNSIKVCVCSDGGDENTPNKP